MSGEEQLHFIQSQYQ